MPKWTKEYQRQYLQKYRQENKARLQKQVRDWKRNNQSKSAASNRKEREQIKAVVLSKYSTNGFPHCVVCGFSNIDALCIDHINNDGAKHRLEISGKPNFAGTSFYRWLKKNNYPVGFQVLCANCNLIKEVQCRRK
jgi:Tfp pilus assembly protein PilV